MLIWEVIFMFIDTHAHLFDEYYSNIEEVIARALDNNVLKIMLSGKENKDAPYELFREMLTVNEKYNMSRAYEFNKEKDKDFSIEFTVKTKNETTLKEEEKTVTYYGISTFDEEVKTLMFEANEIKVKGKEYDFLDDIKDEQKLTVGII